MALPRKQSCYKIKFASKSDALRGMEKVARKSEGKKFKFRGGRAYQCPRCKAWHWTSEDYFWG